MKKENGMNVLYLKKAPMTKMGLEDDFIKANYSTAQKLLMSNDEEKRIKRNMKIDINDKSGSGQF